MFWRVFWYGGIFGPFFFENKQGAAVTVNGERYCAMRIFVSKNWRGWHGRHFVSIGRGHLPHSQRNNRSFAHCFQKSNKIGLIKRGTRPILLSSSFGRFHVARVTVNLTEFRFASKTRIDDTLVGNYDDWRILCRTCWQGIWKRLISKCLVNSNSFVSIAKWEFLLTLI